MENATVDKLEVSRYVLIRIDLVLDVKEGTTLTEETFETVISDTLNDMDYNFSVNDAEISIKDTEMVGSYGRVEVQDLL